MKIESLISIKEYKEGKERLIFKNLNNGQNLLTSKIKRRLKKWTR